MKPKRKKGKQDEEIEEQDWHDQADGAWASRELNKEGSGSSSQSERQLEED